MTEYLKNLEKFTKRQHKEATLYSNTKKKKKKHFK